jgi:hypothetical protein
MIPRNELLMLEDKKWSSIRRRLLYPMHHASRLPTPDVQTNKKIDSLLFTDK